MREEDLSAPERLDDAPCLRRRQSRLRLPVAALIRQAMDAVPVGEVLKIRSTEITVREDLPAWCRLTQNPYHGWRTSVEANQYFVRRGGGQKSDAACQQARHYRWQTRTRWQGGNQTTVFCRNHSWAVGEPASFD